MVTKDPVCDECGRPIDLADEDVVREEGLLFCDDDCRDTYYEVEEDDEEEAEEDSD